jgi:hypothetical protein
MAGFGFGFGAGRAGRRMSGGGGAAPAATYYYRQGHDVWIALTDLHPTATGATVASGGLPAGLSVSGGYIVGRLTGAAVTGTVTLSVAYSGGGGGSVDVPVRFVVAAGNLRAPTIIAETLVDATGTVSGGVVDYTLTLGVRDQANSPVAVAVMLYFRGTSPDIASMAATIGGQAATVELRNSSTSNQRSAVVYLPPTILSGSTATLHLTGIGGTVTASNTLVYAYSLINVSADAHPFFTAADTGTSTISPTVDISVSDYGFAAVLCAQTAITSGASSDCVIYGNLVEDFRKTGLSTQGVYRFVGHLATDEVPILSATVGNKALLDDGVTLQTGTNVDVVAFSLRGADSVQAVPGVLPLSVPAASNMVGLAAPVIGENYQIDLREGHYGWSANCVYTVSAGSLPSGYAITGTLISAIPMGAHGATTITITCTRSATGEAVNFTFDIPATVASANLISGAPTFGTTPGTVANGYSLDLTSAANRQYGYWTIASALAGRTYRFRARITSGATAADNQDIWVRAVHTLTTLLGGYEPDEQYGIISEDYVKSGAQTVDVEMYFRAKINGPVYIMAGRIPAAAPGTNTAVAVATTNVTITLLGHTCELIADSIADGDAGSISARWYREGPFKFVMNRATTWRRALQGQPIAQTDDVDPLMLQLATPVCHKGGVLRSTQTTSRQLHGGQFNHGVERSVSIRPSYNGFTEGPSANDCATTYAVSANRDPHNIAAPVSLISSKIGNEGAFTKVMSHPYMYGADNQYVNLDGTTLFFVPGAKMPGAGVIPFACATSIKQKYWVDSAIVDDAAADAATKFTRPGGYITLAQHQIDIDYLATQRPTDADGHSPNNDAMHFCRQQGTYRRITLDAIGSLFAALVLDDVPLSYRKKALKALIQRGIIDNGWVLSGGTFVPGGASAQYLPGQIMAALLMPAGVQAAQKSALGTTRSIGEAIVPGATASASGWDAHPDRTLFKYVNQALINVASLTVSGQTNRPRTPYTQFMLGMPEWRNYNGAVTLDEADPNASGSNKRKDGYLGININGAAIIFTAMRRYPGALAAYSNQAALDAVDRFISWQRRDDAEVSGKGNYVRGSAGVVGGDISDAAGGPNAFTWGDVIGAGNLAIFAQGRSVSGAPVSQQRWGLVETGTALVNQAGGGTQTATSIPVLRSWPVGVPTNYDVAQEFFSDWPVTARSIGQCYDATMAPISTPAWIANGSGTNITVTAPDTLTLVFVDITGSNANGSATARVAIRGS